MEQQARGIGIEFISVFGQPPVEFVKLAADLGCRHIGISLSPLLSDRHPSPVWSLRNDAGLRRDMIAAMRDKGVSISIGEGFLIMPGVDIATAAADMDVMCELGVPVVNVLSLDPDRNRGVSINARCSPKPPAPGRLAATLEFVPGLPIGDLPTTLAAVRHVGRPNFRRAHRFHARLPLGVRGWRTSQPSIRA